MRSMTTAGGTAFTGMRCGSTMTTPAVVGNQSRPSCDRSALAWCPPLHSSLYMPSLMPNDSNSTRFFRVVEQRIQIGCARAVHTAVGREPHPSRMVIASRCTSPLPEGRRPVSGSVTESPVHTLRPPPIVVIQIVPRESMDMVTTHGAAEPFSRRDERTLAAGRSATVPRRVQATGTRTGPCVRVTQIDAVLACQR